MSLKVHPLTNLQAPVPPPIINPMIRARLRLFRDYGYERGVLPWLSWSVQNKLSQTLSKQVPRIVFVKQDIQSDLYCCPAQSSARDMVCSTLMRTGPVALFTRLKANFLVVRTENDPECRIWQQPALELGWVTLESSQSLGTNVPGRTYGQSAFAIPVTDVDWRQYDIVISLDVSVPARVTKRFPEVLWCYYVREPKTSAYAKSCIAPLPGQDVFLNQKFRINRSTASLRPYELEFPYYFQYVGCFDDLLTAHPQIGEQRSGIFLEHHTPDYLTENQFTDLENYGSLYCTAVASSSSENRYISGGGKSAMTPEEIIRCLGTTKYFVKLGGSRNVWGNAMVEAIATGNLALGDPRMHTHGFLLSPATSIKDFDDLQKRLNTFESMPRIFKQELYRQQMLVNYLCFLRPALDLINARNVKIRQARKP